jgi:hypothetical protein
MLGISNEYDEIIFNYLEGNLSGDEKNAFEMLMSSNERLRTEVRAWKKTYMAESFQVTAKLEKQILGSVKRTRWFFSLNVFTAVLILMFIPARVKDVTITRSVLTSAKTIGSGLAHHDAKSVYLPESLVNQKQQLKRHIDKEETIRNILELVKKDKFIKSKNAIAVLPVPETSTLKIISPSVQIPPPIQLSKASRVKKFSWKETRAINRKKRKDYQRKTESKFLEGNVPYVVPLADF